MRRKAKSQATHSGMAVVKPNAAAIDIGAASVQPCCGGDGRRPRIRSGSLVLGFSLLCTCWLIDLECGVKTVVMESTSVYLIPIFELLDERGFEVILVNARDAGMFPVARRT
jgi:transposase